MRHTHWKVYGRVQGVGFRKAAEREGQRLGLKGWVRNLEDVGVEILAQGEPQVVQILVDWSRRGPAFAQVETLEIVSESTLEGDQVEAATFVTRRD